MAETIPPIVERIVDMLSKTLTEVQQTNERVEGTLKAVQESNERIAAMVTEHTRLLGEHTRMLTEHTAILERIERHVA